MTVSELTGLEIVYWFSAIFGGTIFLLRTALLLFGGGLDFGDGDADVHLETDHSFDLDHHLHHDVHTDVEVEHADADLSFKLLSLQGLTAFFMMFGLVGIGLNQIGLHTLLGFAGALAAGFFIVWVMGVIFAALGRLQSDGTMQIKNAIGQNGSVYLTIPPKGSGQVRVAVDGSLKILNAVSKDGKKIATGENIRVVDITGGDTLIVEKFN
jgi:membrane protein implicated in regulation of membrane protease activity